MAWYESPKAQEVVGAFAGGKNKGGKSFKELAKEFGITEGQVRGVVKWYQGKDKEQRLIAPFVGNYEKVLFLFDAHIPDEDPTALKIAKEFAEDWKPTRTIFGGDWQSADSASCFPNEETATLEEEYRREEEWLDIFKPTDWMEGNHEERIRRIAGKVDPRFRSLLDPVRNLHLQERGVRIYPYHPKNGIITLGYLTVLHGWFCGQYAARQHAQAYGCCLYGHCHTFQTFTPSNAFESSTGFGIGCLCKLDLPYLSNRPPRAWIQGFSFGYFLPSGHFSLYDVRIIGKEVVINGKVYSR